MKRIILTALVLTSMVTIAPARRPTTLLPNTDIYVRVNESSPSSTLVFIGNHYLPPAGSNTVSVSIVDTRPNPDVTVQRVARRVDGTQLLVDIAFFLFAPPWATIQ